MPGVIAFPDQRIKAEFSVLSTSSPRRTVGVFLWNGLGLTFRLRDDWTDFEDAEYLECLEDDFALKIKEMGGEAFLLWMEDSLSNFLLLSERESAAKSLDALYREYVDDAVMPYKTHIPVYSLRAAATKFGDERSVEEEDWVTVKGQRLTEGMFAAHVVGRSMEPLIPDGSLCLFRGPVVGSRQNKIVLIEQFGVVDGEARYSVKKYSSKKVLTADGWEHESIKLKPLNREFDAFELAGYQFRVIAEFVKVLDS